jgi:hypothetical protein
MLEGLYPSQGATTKDIIMKKYKSYGLLYFSKSLNLYLGKTEHSFSMDFSSDRVRIYSSWEINAFSKENLIDKFLKTQISYTKKDIAYLNKKYNVSDFQYILFRAGSKNAPVKIHWKDLHKNNKDKFERRNPKFTLL